MRPSPLAAVVVLTIGAAALSGCAPAPATPDPAEVEEWMSEQPTDDDVLSVFTAGAEAGRSAVPGEGILAAFAEPLTVETVEFSCLGEGTMSVEVAVTSAGATRTVGAQGLPCADGPHAFDADDLGGSRAVESVRADGYDSSVTTAWRVVVRGSETD